MLLFGPSRSGPSRPSGTMDFYESSARQYAADTRVLDMGAYYDKFLPLIPPGGHILDAGCGSGRDTKEFLARGFQVTATDASAALAREAAALTGIDIGVARHEDMRAVSAYDGIWACATLLHVPRATLPSVMSKLVRALNPGGVLFATFKHGETERMDSMSRNFTDQTEDSLRALLSLEPSLGIVSVSVCPDATRADTAWIAVVARKFSNP